MAEQHSCNNPACPIDGVAAFNRMQSEFYRENDRTIDARD